VSDANGWIGELPSRVSTIIDGEQKEEREYARKSEKKETNKQGKWFLEEMNSINMVIVNGLKTEAKHTYDTLSREAKSIVDYIAVKESMLEEVSEITYIDERNDLQTDHILLSMYFDRKEEVKTEIEIESARRRKRRRAKEKAKKPAMEFMKVVTREDPFWDELENHCDDSLREFVVQGETKIDEDYSVFKEKLKQGVENTLRKCKPHRHHLTARLREDGTVRKLRRKKRDLFEKIKAEREVERRLRLKRELSKASNLLRRRTKKVMDEFKTKQVAEIERLEPDDCRRMWKELKTLSGWQNKEKVSDVLFNERKEEISGEGVQEVWKEAFRVLGIEDAKDERFDHAFGEQVTREQEEIRERSHSAESVNEELDKAITFEEVKAAVGRLKLGKAAGNDEVVAEILVKGGVCVINAVKQLCEKAWNEEKLPTDWCQGIIFPIYKDGEKKDTNNYRGITLLSIVGKVYAQVINYRLMKYSEENNILVEEQGGFRPGRGCPDQIFSLVEILRNRKKTKYTYCCFIDVKKAFDRVFRAGLWKRIAEEGVKGKMWRVLVSIYERVESCVRVEGNLTDWFPVETGVRQGCVLSPLLYAFFINGLVRELNELGVGIHIEGRERKLCCLLYADDIVMMTENRKDLQSMLDVVARYAKKWRFELNSKKSEVVVFGRTRAPKNIVWKMGEDIIKQVAFYKYLGIELTRTLSYKKYLTRIITKAKRNLVQTLAMGIKGGFMTPRLGNIMWTNLVRSIVEYGSEVWGEREVKEIDQLQHEMGKRILRCSKKTSKEVVRGELGWERQIARRDEMRLRYFARIVRMREGRVAKQIYKASRSRLEQEEREEKKDMTDTWCFYTRKLMYELNLRGEWEEERVGGEEDWNELVRERIHEREQEEWRRMCLSKSKLRTYAILKRVLRVEPYLSSRNIRGIPELVKLRGGTNRLRIEQGRYRREEVEERICLCCERKEVEDERHFMLVCALYEDKRRDMWREYEEITEEKKELLSSDEQMTALLGDRHQPPEGEDKLSLLTTNYKELIKTVMRFIINSMNTRFCYLEAQDGGRVKSK